MEGNVGNRRNDHHCQHHESHHHYHENHHHHLHHQTSWNFSQDPSTSTHLPPFGQLSSSCSSPSFSSLSHQNDDHHQYDAFFHSPTYLPNEAKASQSFLFAPTDLLDSSDLIHHSPAVASDSLTLRLGKRHYYENTSNGALGKLGPMDDPQVPGFSLLKRGREFLSHFHLHPQHNQPPVEPLPPSKLSPAVAVVGMSVPRCQVEGCNMGLIGAKEYHRRHKVCEMHSKAPKVIVQGLEQRFCQQCSRFHVVSEFDDSKRSCRRRLAGHNERRRKNCSDSTTKNHAQESRGFGGRLPLMTSSAGRALSLLSSESSPTWAPTSAAPADEDFFSHSSAALGELIAENRAAVLAKHLVSPDDVLVIPHNPGGSHHRHQQFIHSGPQPSGPRMFEREPATETTLELMQASHAHSQHPTYQLLAPRSGRPAPASGDDEDAVEFGFWKSFE